MTCEVAIANRIGIALAADSAVTFSEAGDDKRTYATGANKIFQLALQEPVAVMIYSNAVLSGVPWEVIIKAHRADLGGQGFDRLHEYAENLTTFINACSSDLIPAELKAHSSVATYRTAALHILDLLESLRPELGKPDTDAAILRASFADAVRAVKGSLSETEVIKGLRIEDMAHELHSYSSDLAGEVAEFVQGQKPHLAEVFNFEEIAQISIESAFRISPKFLNDYTGVVIAGFGRKDFLPGYCNFRFYGFIGSRVLWDVQDSKVIDYQRNGSIIQGFARQAMVETFTQGASPQVWKAVGDAYESVAYKLCRSAAASAGVELNEDAIRQAVGEHRAEFMKSWTYAMFDEHLKPLWRVVAGLSVEELAELAETLVQLESLKEKVTSRTQSVGGPIDVAVITKSEGLVWIKRKLYFDQRLNPRYFQRIALNHTGASDE